MKRSSTEVWIEIFGRNSFVRRIVRILIPILLGISLGTVIMVLFENKFIYFPYKYPEGIWEPEVYGLKAEDCFFTTSDGFQLHGWFFQVESPKATVLWCHGNAGNITHRLDNIRRLLSLGINVFIFDYRGYGRSEGEPSEDGVYRDAFAAYDFLIKNKGITPDSMIIFGRSLGAIVAVELTSERPCRGLILESSFTSAKDMAKELFPILPVHFFIRSKFDAESKIRSIHVPIFFTHGIDDRTVPVHLGKKLFEEANEPKSFYGIPGADHNDTYIVGGDEYFRRLDTFIDEALARK